MSEGEASETKPRRSSPAGWWKAAAAAVLLIAGYVLVLVLYSAGDSGDGPDAREPSASGALVYLDIDAVQGQDYSVTAHVSVYPGTDLLDADGYLAEPLVVDVSPIAADGRLEFAANTRVGPLPVALYADGDARHWPFDRYTADSVVVRVFSEQDSKLVPVDADLVVTDSAAGWDVDVSENGPDVDIAFSRTLGALVFDIALCALLIVLPMCALFVSVQTVRRRKQFLPPMITWFAVMLFAVLPIRNLFPGSPPIGSWVDYSVVLWVVGALVVAQVLYVTAWWKQAP